MLWRWWEGMWGRPRPPEVAGPSPVDAADVERRVALLRRLAQELGYDPSLVSLSLETSSFTLAGESSAAEGRALADGRILVYYDAHMSNARMGCCLAHEIQHQKYFAVRAAFRREPPDGPLHGRFGRFTPELLAALRGVSDYSNEHWDAWRSAQLPALFSDEMALGAAEPINETLAEIAKADYNFGPAAKIDPLWRELFDEVNAVHRRLVSTPADDRPQKRPGSNGDGDDEGVSNEKANANGPPAIRKSAGGFASLSRLLGFRDRARVADAPLALIAASIEANLRALGLCVRAKHYGPHFCEIVASTSSELITKPDDPCASGVALLLAGKYDPPTLVFEEINSRQKGLGAVMVDAVTRALDASPVLFRRLRVDDASPHDAEGRSFWLRMAERHARYDWAITQNERERAERLNARGASRPSPP